jgi:archaellum component FlaG (FlaF/FlaG flagellin family)
VTVRVVFFIAYILVLAVAAKLLSNAVDHVWHQFVRKGNSGPA